jgi:hypothetical protein
MNSSLPRLVLFVLFMLALSPKATANAPSGRYTVSAGTVYDTKTKLTWQQVFPTTSYNWADAWSYCASSVVSSALGGSGWRLPTVKELQTLVDYSQPTTALLMDSTAFSGTPTTAFWSATPVAGSSSSAWTVAFNYIAYTKSASLTQTLSVRCVR